MLLFRLEMHRKNSRINGNTRGRMKDVNTKENRGDLAAVKMLSTRLCRDE